MSKFNDLFKVKYTESVISETEQEIINKENDKVMMESMVNGITIAQPEAVFKIGNINECEKINVLELKDIILKFGKFTLFNKLNFTIPDFKGKGQFITIMGKSGCGKTQLSRLISGLNKPDNGEILLYGKPYTDKTFIPTVFQQYSSFDWMTVLENVELPMKMKGVDKDTRRKKAMELIELVGLKGHENKWAKMPPLSGGQLQRVALARALASDSQIIVLDEYSSGLDVASKATMQNILMNIFNDRRIDRTLILITHDISEALFLSQRIFIMSSETHNFSKVIDIDYGNEIRNRDEILSSEKYKEYYKEVEKLLKE